MTVARTVDRRAGETLKDRKKAAEDSEETQELEQSSDVASEDDTKRLRTLTVQN